MASLLKLAVAAASSSPRERSASPPGFATTGGVGSGGDRRSPMRALAQAALFVNRSLGDSETKHVEDVDIENGLRSRVDAMLDRLLVCNFVRFK